MKRVFKFLVFSFVSVLTAGMFVFFSSVEAKTSYVTSVATSTNYAIENYSTGKALAPDDNGTAIMEQHDFNDTNMVYVLVYSSSGYYRIKNVDKGTYVTVPSGKTSTANTAVELQSYVSNDRQIWKVAYTSSGKFTITSKANSTMYLSVGAAVANTNGVNIRIRTLSAAGNKAYWYFYKTTNVGFAGVYASGHDHSSCFSTCETYLENYDCHYDFTKNIGNSSDNVTRAEYITLLKKSVIFESRSHGYCSTSDSGVVCDGGYGIGGAYMTNNSVSCTGKLCIFAACSTAGCTTQNICKSAVANGAKTAIGFTTTQDCTGLNTWSKYFFYYFYQGYSIQNCCQKAANAVGSTATCQDYVIYGSSTATRASFQ